jgi:hypothetical protein
MLAGHIVPGYFAAVASQPSWKPEWGTQRRTALWVAAIASTILPDFDVIYNVLFRGVINHNVLWTHSLFLYLAIAALWVALRWSGRWLYATVVVGLFAVGGLSHLLLDAITHGTPLFYPISMFVVGLPPQRVVEGGFWAYITDPIFVLEPVALMLVALHWISCRRLSPTTRRILKGAVVTVSVLLVGAYVLLLPTLQHWVEPMMSP